MKIGRAISKKPHRRQAGSMFMEGALTLLLHLVVIIGGLEYNWHLHVRQSMLAAGREGARILAVVEQGSGQTGDERPALGPFVGQAVNATRTYLSGAGLSAAAVEDISTGYLDQLISQIPGAPGVPAEFSDQFVGVSIAVPWSKALIAGGFASKVLGVSGIQTSLPNYRVTALMVKEPWTTGDGDDDDDDNDDDHDDNDDSDDNDDNDDGGDSSDDGDDG